MNDTYTGVLRVQCRSVREYPGTISLQEDSYARGRGILPVLIRVLLFLTIFTAGVQADENVRTTDAMAYLAGLDDPGKAIEEYNKNSILVKQLEAAGWVLKNPLVFYDTLSFCNREIQKDPENPRAYYNKANVLMRMGRYETALETIDNAIQIYPEYAHAWEKKAILLEKMGRTQEAGAAYIKAKHLQIPD